MQIETGSIPVTHAEQVILHGLNRRFGPAAITTQKTSDQIPTLPSGKLDRKVLRAMLTTGSLKSIQIANSQR